MTFRNFDQIERYILDSGIKKTVALANAQDEPALSSVIYAQRKGVIDAILIGELDGIRAILSEHGEDEADYKLVECHDEREAAELACQMVKDGEADFPMKGIMLTANFMRAILNKERGFFPEGSLLSQATVLQYDAEDRLVILTDCAVNIAPDVDQKEKITRNAVELAHRLGIEKPKIAFLSALEIVNPKIPSTVEAAELVRRFTENPDEGIGEVAGPLALDSVVSEESARHKNLYSPVCGHADIMVMPDLCAGNIFSKGLNFYAHLESAGALNGSTVPVVMTSRADTPDSKYRCILLAIMQSL